MNIYLRPLLLQISLRIISRRVICTVLLAVLALWTVQLRAESFTYYFDGTLDGGLSRDNTVNGYFTYTTSGLATSLVAWNFDTVGWNLQTRTASASFGIGTPDLHTKYLNLYITDSFLQPLFGLSLWFQLDYDTLEVTQFLTNAPFESSYTYGDSSFQYFGQTLKFDSGEVHRGEAPAPTPEPSSLLLLGSGALGIGAQKLRKRVLQ